MVVGIHDITKDSVKIAGTRVLRPDSISPGQWLEFWEETIQLHEIDNEHEFKAWLENR